MRTFAPSKETASGADESKALQAMLNEGPGVVQMAPGQYHFGDISVPEGVMLVGSGPATVIRSNGSKNIFRQTNLSAWAIRDLVLDGQASEEWTKRIDAGENGINVEKCWGYGISGVTLRNFRGVGLQLAYTKLGPATAPFSNGGSLDRVTAHGNHIGIRFDERAEYLNATRLDCFQNVTGLVIHAGNVKIAASNICSNTDGVLIEDKENGSHGALANCLINHNFHAALVARNVRNGMGIDNCAFFYGAIEILQSQGVNITASQINCHVRVIGDDVNRIAGNYVIPAEYKFEFAPKTLVEGNFSAGGTWPMSRPMPR